MKSKPHRSSSISPDLAKLLYSKPFAEFIGALLGDGSIGIYKCKSKEGYQIIQMLKRHNFKFILSPPNHRAKLLRIQLNGREQLLKWLKLVNFSNKKHLKKITKFLYTPEGSILQIAR